MLDEMIKTTPINHVEYGFSLIDIPTFIKVRESLINHRVDPIVEVAMNGRLVTSSLEGFKIGDVNIGLDVDMATGILTLTTEETDETLQLTPAVFGTIEFFAIRKEMCRYVLCAEPDKGGFVYPKHSNGYYGEDLFHVEHQTIDFGTYLDKEYVIMKDNGSLRRTCLAYDDNTILS